jgi:nitrogenase molybdenum-iron protein alpha chain
MDMTLNNPCWGKMVAPWLKKAEPEVEKKAA